MQTHLWVASNNLFASVRSYKPPLEAASRTGLCPLKKYPQLGWGMIIVCRKPRVRRVVQWKLKRCNNDIKTPFDVECNSGLGTAKENIKRRTFKVNDTHSLSHTKWNCKYHIVFAPKYRRKVFYADKRLEIGAILRELCKCKGVNIIEAEVCPDHVHMLLEIPPNMSISSFMGFLKGKSSLMIYEKWGNARYQYRNREFWSRGYYVDTVGKNTKAIAEYIQNQLREDAAADQLTMEDIDPFTGSR